MATEQVFAGGAITTVRVQSGFNAGASTFAGDVTPTGFPTGTHLVVVGVIEDGRVVSNVEKMLVTRSGSTFTVVQRGFDGTSAASHSAGEAILHIGPSAELLSALYAGYSQGVGAFTTKGDLIVASGAAQGDNLAAGSNGLPLVVNSGATLGLNYAQLAATGIASDAITAAKILDANVTEAKLATDSVTAAKIAAGAVDTAELAAGAVETAKIEDANVTLAKLAAAAMPRWKEGPFTFANVENASATAGSVADTNNVEEVVACEAGSILGLSVAMEEARTAGTVSFEVYKNGSGTGLTVTINGTNTQFHYATQARGLDTFVAGDRLSVVATASSLTPTSNNAVATILCSL